MRQVIGGRLMKNTRWTIPVLILLFSFSAFTPFSRAKPRDDDEEKSSEDKAARSGTLEGEEVCIDPSIKKELKKCPKGAKMKKMKAPRARVGGGRARDEIKKKKKEQQPGLEASLVQSIKMSAFKKKRERRSLQLLQREIQLINQLAKQTPDSNPDKAEILKRLADAYQDMYQQIYFMARELDEQIFQAKKAKKKSKAKSMAKKQRALEDKSKEFRKKAIQTFVDIRNNFPDYPQYDEILYSIGYGIDQMANEERSKAKKAKYRERAREFYQELIKGFPRSRYIPHAWMSFAEYYFNEAKDVAKALRSYRKVVEWGEEGNPNYILAMYYIAWCYFNQQEYQQTINQFVKVIKFADDHQESREAKAVARRSRMELIDSYSKIGNPSKAWDFFQKIGGDQSFMMLEKLAEQYYDEGHWADAIIVYHQLIKVEPEGENVCDYQYAVTNAVISSRPKDEQLDEIKRQIDISEYYLEQKHKKENEKRCRSNTVQIAVDTATHWHVEAVGTSSSPGTNDVETMEITIELYDTILEHYPDIDEIKLEGYKKSTKPTIYRIAYYKAELLWKMEKWNSCAPAFDKVVEMDPAGEYVESAAYAAVLCYNNVYQQEHTDDRSRKFKLKTDAEKEKDKKRKKKKGKKKDDEEEAERLAKRDLTDTEQGMLKAYQRYICYVKKSDDLIRIKYRRARIYYEANWMEEAAVLFQDIAYNHSEAEEEMGIYAANLYLDCLNAIGQYRKIPSCYDDLAVAVDVFLDESKAPGKNLMQDPDFNTQIKQLKCGVLRKKAESYTDRERYKEAALTYIDIYKNYQVCGGLDEVLWNAAINFESGRLVGAAIKVREAMIEKFPDSEHSKRALYYIGQNYHALAIYSKAAQYYEDYGRKYPGEEEAPLALKNATTFRIGLGKTDNAFDNAKLFEKNYYKRRPEDAATVFFGVGGVYVDSNDYDNIIKHYTRYLKKYSRAGNVHEIVIANVRIAEAYEKRKKPDIKKARSYYKKALTIYKKGAMDKITGTGSTPEEKEASANMAKAQMLIAAAHAEFALADEYYYEFKDIKFPLFKVEKKTSKKVEKWWQDKIKEQMGEEQYNETLEYKKQLKIWRRWNMPAAERKKIQKEEEAKERATAQFQYWLENKFVDWVKEKQEALTKAETEFGKVLEYKVPQWEIAAAARVGDMKLEFMQSLYDAPVPPSIEEDIELKTIYQQSLDEKAEPYREGAVAALQHCLIVATKVRWFSEDSLRCEESLNKLDPRQFPVSQEMRTLPTSTGTVLATPTFIDHLETAAERRERKLTEGAAEAAGAKDDPSVD